MNDPELKALSTIAAALADLTEEQTKNVLLYVNARYGGVGSRTEGKPPANQVASSEAGEYASLGDFFDAANPQTEADRVLVVSYWLQAVEGAADFEAFPVNKHLKNLGHSVSNITRAIDSLIDQTPRCMLQTGKSGSSQQARKKYKVTREGLKRVQSMLARVSRGGDDN